MTTEEFINSIKLDGEEWRPIPSWENLYYASTFGRIIRAKSKTWPCSLMTPYKMYNKKKIYLGIKLQHSGFRGHYTVHRLVALTFIPNPNNYPCIDHIDCDSTNNNVQNLRWCSPSLNNHNPISIQRQSESHKGKVNNTQNKSVVQLKNGELIRIYRSILEVEKYGYTHSSVSRVCNKKLSTYKGYNWMFLAEYETLVNKSKNSQSTLD